MRLFTISVFTLSVLLCVFTFSEHALALADWPQRRTIEPKTLSATPKPDLRPAIDYACGETNRCDLDRFMERTKSCVVHVMKQGRHVLHRESTSPHCASVNKSERYGVASVAKSLTSLLFGMIMTDPKHGIPLNLNDPAKDALGRAGIKYPGKATIRQLLHMSSGMKWCETQWGCAPDTPKVRIEADDQSGHPSGRHSTLRQAVIAHAGAASFRTPGKFNYSAFDSTLLGVLVENRMQTSKNAAATTLAAGLEEFIWKTRNTRRPAQWKADFDAHSPAYCCLKASAGDLAEIGSWVLESYKAGMQGSTDPIARWVKESVTDTVASGSECEFKPEGFKQELRYGYQWWVLSGEGHGFTALGKGGQFIHVLPEADVVVVQLGQWRGFSRDEINDARCESYVVHRLLARHSW